MLSHVWWALYVSAALVLLVFGAHAVRLLLYARRHGPAYRAHLADTRARSAIGTSRFPSVVVQLPVYNEPRVVERLIEAAAALDWPREKLEIQVLDDSTDGSNRLVASAVERECARGVSVRHLRREQRTGYKAGALAAGLERTEAEFVAIFDADFLPDRDFLVRALPLFDASERVACVQGRWVHLNREQSFLTRAQATAVDAHFCVQQMARAAGAGFLNFNGSAGVWRRAAIDDAGGWSAATLTEDLDLSFRAQLRGWRVHFDPELTVPSELPPTLAAYKSQQRRWATGSMQCARRFLGPLWRGSAPFAHKLEGSVHLLGYSVCVAMASFTALLPLGVGHLVLVRAAPWMWPVWFAVWLAALGPLLVAIEGRRASGEHGGALFPAVRAALGAALLGLGTSANNARAVVRGLFVKEAEFVRTPKQGRGRRNGGPLPRLELTFAALTLMAAVLLAVRSPIGLLAYVLYCASGFWGLSWYWWRHERRFEHLT